MKLGEIALIGTARGGELEPSETPVDDLLTGLGPLALERRILLAAGAVFIYQLAGRPASAAPPVPEPAEKDLMPPCSATVEAVLRDMLLDGHHDLLPEALDLVARAGYRLPPGLLTPCLDLRERLLREAVRPVLGARGRWLAHQREEWQWARARADSSAVRLETLQQVWNEGRIDERTGALEAMRAADPAQGREWVAAAWGKEKVDDRLRLLGVLASDLSQGDEAWLESALKDRSPTVRREVALLLVRISGSAAAQRATARADDCLAWQTPEGSVWDRVKAGLAGRPPGNLLVRPPTEASADWERDGVQQKPPKGIGERAHWLAELLTFVDPAHWTARFSATPHAIVEAASRTEWAAPMLVGWSCAALLHKSADWMPALWDGWLAMHVEKNQSIGAAETELQSELMAAMPADDARPRLVRMLTDGDAGGVDLPSALMRLPRPWSEDVSNAVLSAIDQRLRTTAPSLPGRMEAIGMLEAAGIALSPDRFPDAERITVEDVDHPFASAWTRACDRFITQMTLRRRLYEEIRK